ncbi:nuclear transcription factor Y subunit B-4-like isoform X2 [Wolffia australiana]
MRGFTEGNANNSDDSSGLTASFGSNVDNSEAAELQLPIEDVGRIMEKILPSNAKLSQDARETVQESATEFISFVTSEAAAKCQNENRKTISADDICWGLGNVGLNNYGTAVRRYLQKYRDDELESSATSRVSTSDEEYPSLRLFEGDKDSSTDRR